jgi:DNA polymerase III subunit epsilon
VLRRDVPGKALDDWLAAYGIRCLARHQAAADALATAELLLCLWPLARQQHGRPPDIAALQRLAAARRWLGA